MNKKTSSMRLFTSIFIFAAIFITSACNQKGDKKNGSGLFSKDEEEKQEQGIVPIDTAAYKQKTLALANGDTTGRWPVKGDVFPLDGAILPFKRIVAYYGNLYSVKMGILGEVPPKELWKKLDAEVAAWTKADSLTPVQPAIHYIAVVASGTPGKDNKYRNRMPATQIDSALAIAKMGNAIVFLDIQIALSDLKSEVPLLEKYLKMPHVHLGIDPEFSMKDGSKPGKKIGSMDASDINYCSEYLAKLVKDNNLPPKILIVHRFTQGMVRNYKNVKLRPEVQIIINMDGWGEPILKKSTYKLYIKKEPVQFTGFKLFYKNDLKKAPHTLMTPEDLMKLTPRPIYIQYQ